MARNRKGKSRFRGSMVFSMLSRKKERVERGQDSTISVLFIRRRTVYRQRRQAKMKRLDRIK